MKKMITIIGLVSFSLTAFAEHPTDGMTCEEKAVYYAETAVHNRIDDILTTFEQMGKDPSQREFLKGVYRSNLHKLDVSIATLAGQVYDCGKK
jgi:hypothetical protein